MRSSVPSPVLLAGALLLLVAGCASGTRAAAGAPAADDAAENQDGRAREPAADAAPQRDAAATGLVVDAAVNTSADVGPSDAKLVVPPDVAPVTAGHCPAGYGPPTKAELKSLSDQMKASPYVPSGTNQGNNLAYGNGAKMSAQLTTMYALTGDTYFLDQMIVFADYMLSVRNDVSSAPRKIWTGAVEPCWPNKAATDPDAAYCGTENGLVLDHIAGVARAIVANKALWSQPVGVPDPHHFGSTYEARARTYLKEVNHTLDAFLVPRYLQPTKGNRLYVPVDSAFAALGPSYTSQQGHPVPWNQQDMITGALSTVADALMSLGEDPMRIATNDQITRAAIDWFVSELGANQYMASGHPVYKWGYIPGDLKHIENLAHASADINMLYKAYKHGRFGVTTPNMVPMANTFLDVIAKPGGTYAANVDGTGDRGGVSDAWLNYEEFRSGIAATLHPKLTTIDANTSIPIAIAVLNMRQNLCP